MPSLVELRKRYLSGLSPDQTAGIEYYTALLETIAGRSAEDSPLIQQLIQLLGMKGSALPVTDVSRITRSLGQSSPLDVYIFDIFEYRPDLSGHITGFIYGDKDSLDDRRCAAWCRFMLEQGYKPENGRAVGLLLEKNSPLEEIKVLQLALSTLYSDSGFPDTAKTARSCIERIIRESPAGIALGMEAAKVLHDSALYHSKQTAEELTRFIRQAEDTAGTPLEEPLKTYRSFYKQLPFLRLKGLLIVQFLFYGDPDHSGSGASGGLGTIVRDLGTALSELPGIAGVITVTIYDTAEAKYPYEPVGFAGEKHAILRMPLYLGNAGSERFIQLRGEIQKEVGRITSGLIEYGPDVSPLYHVRYLDSAALSCCKAAKQAGIPAVMTLTPDPHRAIDRRHDQRHHKPAEEILNNFERIVTGDTLIELADGIIGIGRRSITTSLLPYFPQLADMQEKQLAGIDEGIMIGCGYPPVDIRKVLTNGESPLQIDNSSADRPLIVNIGRLHPGKGQISLLRAWSEHGLWHHYNLLVIGGDFIHPNEYERETIDFFIDYVTENPQVCGKVALHPALPNSAVRSLHSLLAQREIVHLPDIYVCSSLKEEFGLSIIEAMSAGMIVLAPLSGGAVEYIRHGINGFLIDTGSADALGREIVTCIERYLISHDRMRAIQVNAKNTVERKYSLEKIAGDFLEFYHKVLEGVEKKDEIR